MTRSVPMSLAVGVVLALAGAGGGCGGDSSGSPEARATSSVKAQIASELDNLVASATALRAAAPAPDADGWSLATDMAAVSAMRTQWKATRVAYERVEGAIAVLFPNYDVSTDERYDGFIAEAPDANLFDGEGVTGVHAIERILWAGEHPPAVVAFEASLVGYEPASFPMTMAQATEFRDGLATRLVTDAQAMRDMFKPLALDAASAFRGVIGSIAEQVEKVTLASTGEEESRYAQHTLGDMRANLEGGRKTYDSFRTWVRSTPGGTGLDADIMAGFGRVEVLYQGVTGDALPPVPEGFVPTAPTAAQLATPYGVIFAGLGAESNPDDPNSLVAKMVAAADLIGIPELPE